MSVGLTAPSVGDLSALDRRRLLIGLGLLATSATAAALTPRGFERQLGSEKVSDLLPAQFGAWRQRPGGDVIVPEQTQPGSVYDQTAIRTFERPGAPDVALLIAYGSAQSGLMKVHRPEVCYGSAGFRIRAARDTQVPVPPGHSIPARCFEGVRDSRIEQVLYWTRIAGEFPQSMNAERWVTFKAGLRGVIPDGVLVRFSTITPDPAEGERVLLEAAQALVSQCSLPARRFLAGGLLV